MAATKHLFLAFCTDNQQTADEITTDLARVGYILQPKGFSNDLSTGTIGEALEQTKDHVMLLVTDNFLNSAGCLDGMLEATQKMIKEERLIPLIADGRIPKPGGKGWDSIPTTFERVSNVIHYMNNWQDKYLDLRRAIRQNENDQELVERLEVTRKISSEIGELLRLLRSQKCYPLSVFQENGYEVFFKLRNDPANHKEMKELMAGSDEPGKKRPKKDDAQLIEFIKSSSVELMAENLELDKPHHMEPEELAPVEELSNEEKTALEGSLTEPENELQEEPVKEGSEEEEAEVAGHHSQYAESDEAGAKIPQAANETTFDELSDLDKEPDNPVDKLLTEIMEEENEEEVDFELVDEEGDLNIEDIFKEDLRESDDNPSKQSDHTHQDVAKNTKRSRLPNAEEALEIAIKLFEDGQKEQGLGFLQGAVEGQPKDPALRYYYAYALARYAQKFNEATKELKTLLQFDEDYADAWYLLAELAEIRKDYPAAIAHFEKTASIKPAYPDVYYRIGLIHFHHMEGQEDQAAGYFKKSIQFDKKNPDAHYRLATLLNDELNQPEEAIKHYKKTLKFYPDHPFANYDLALVYHKMGKKDEAVEYYKIAANINQELKTPQNDVAFGLISLDETNPGSPEPETVIPSQPESGEQEEFAHLEEEFETALADKEGSEVVVKNENINGAEQEKQEATQTVGQPVSLPSEKPKTILISGATAGIGLATAEIFAKNGFRVIITGRREDRLQNIQSELHEKHGAEILPLNFDVRNIYEVKKAIASLAEEWADVDILVNNAGLSRGLAPIHEGDIDHWDTMIDTNIKGLLYLTRAITPHMVSRRGGHIINVASGAGKEVYPGGNVYCATKFAVDGLTKAMRLDLFKHNIRVSQVSPGHVEETEFARVRFDWDENRAAEVYHNFQPLRASDVAEAIYFIATQPPHVNIQDILLFGTQQAGSNFIDRSGR